MTLPVETAIPFDNHRATPLSMITPFVQGLEQAGMVDYFWIWDELSSWFPRSLWNTENTPHAASRDADSTHDPVVAAGIAAAASSTMGVRLTTDAVRARPTELVRTLMSLAGESSGRVVCALGAGEFRHTKPYGYNRKEGLSRMEDVLRLANVLWDAEEPVDFEGNHWKLSNGYLGSSRPERRPELWALGGGPKLLDLAAEHAAGFETAAPSTSAGPDVFAAQVTDVRERVERFCRDPEQFGCGVWLGCLIHDDPDVLERALDNPIFKAMAALFGRFNQRDWLKEGITPVMPEDWHYAMRYAPFDVTAAEIDGINAQVTTEMMRKSLFVGSTAEISAVAALYVEAGASFVGVLDAMPLLLAEDEVPAAIGRALEVCGAAKAAPGVAAR